MKQPKLTKRFTFEPDDISFEQEEYLSEVRERAFEEELDYIIQKNAYRGHRIEGNYLIAYSLEYARDLTYGEEGDPQWQKLHEENAHIGIAVHDATNLRFITGLTVFVTVATQSGDVIGSFEHPFLKRPNLYHYGRNWKLPGDGRYTLQVRIEIPDAVLRKEYPERALLTPVEVEFKNVAIKTGQKIS
jgi:hypothetical protein